MVLKIATQNIRSYESTIFFILSDLFSLKTRDLHESCWIVVVNHNSIWNGNSDDAVPSNRDDPSLAASHHNLF